ncbi:hypothetical protein TWF481_006393 [Arthrobotrys musiformis]|uniref:Uncharacterized protein n=1 Tax=Arthrobotrys musiformis TaxID=47236 RepID=A0AAV9WM90_9PEZI
METFSVGISYKTGIRAVGGVIGGGIGGGGCGSSDDVVCDGSGGYDESVCEYDVVARLADRQTESRIPSPANTILMTKQENLQHPTSI